MGWKEKGRELTPLGVLGLGGAAAAAAAVGGDGTPGSCVSCTTFNILAPIYKRLDQDESRRESHYKAYWFVRNKNIIDRLLQERSSIICLQEVWLGNNELVDMYKERLGEAGYESRTLARTNDRGDGLLTAVQKENFRILDHQSMFFQDCGDRVAQLLLVESVIPLCSSPDGSGSQQVVIVNTHLLFPHDYSLCIIRLKQVYKIVMLIENYQEEKHLGPMPIILCGDWNGSKRGHVYKFLRSCGFVSSYDTAHHYTDSDADAHKWVSHRNHRGNICGVDFIWLLNPKKHRKPLKACWNEAVLGIIRGRLREMFDSEEKAFKFLKAEGPGDIVTHCSFSRALKQLALTGDSSKLTQSEEDDLWAQLADTNGRGFMDCQDFQSKIWNRNRPDNSGLSCESGSDGEAERYEADKHQEQEQAFGFDVKDAVLFPPEVEKGMWPENYSLSDHAPLTVTFSPRRRILLAGEPVC